MKVGSLFSGIGGLDLACERVFSAETVWQVEGIDLDVAWLAETHPISRKAWAKLKSYARHGAFNRRVLARHWPEARQLCDVRTVGAHNLEPVDVICGGFPCQDLSVAGNRAGLDGSRSGLYRELHRIVGELLPQWVVIENVPGLMKYRARLARDFAELGYGLRWQPIAAQDVGAPHRRRRVFVLACRDWRGSVVLEAPQAGERVAAWPTPTAKIGESGPSKLNRPGHGGGALHDVVHAIWPTPLADGDRSTMFQQGGEPQGLAARRPWPTPCSRDHRTGTGYQPRPGYAPQLPETVGGALNPAWVELLMGLPSGWSVAEGEPMAWPGAHTWLVGRGAAQPEGEPPRLVEPGSVPNRNLRLRSLGNGVVPQQAIEALARCLRGPRQRDLFAG